MKRNALNPQSKPIERNEKKTMKRYQSIRYTIQHRKAFRRCERELTGHNSIRGYTHDLAKLILKIFLPLDTVSKLHRKHSRHHERARTREDYIQMIIDWECARATKPDKPLNAQETLYVYYPELTDTIEPLLKELDIYSEELAINYRQSGDNQ